MIGLSVIESRALRAALRAEGFDKVHHAEDAVEAAAVMASELVDVVFTPAAGPGFTLRDAFGLLHGRGPNRHAAVVLVGTAIAQPDVVAAVKAGVRGVLTLPARKDLLRQLLARLPESAPAVQARAGAPGHSHASAARQRRKGAVQ